MFVKSNELSGLLDYFKRKLKGLYEDREIENIFYFVCDYKFGQSRVAVKTNPKRLSESELLEVREIVNRLITMEPVQYIIGETEFGMSRLLLNENVLIPRPETEELVELVRKWIKGKEKVLDVGTGSGCIPITLKKSFPELTVYAVDISESALALASKSAELNQVEIHFIKADILQSELEEIDEVDIIISNPPYIPRSERKKMQENVLRYEPEIALFVEDDDPLLFYRRIAELGLKKLVKRGKLFFEIHEDFGPEVHQLLTDLGYREIQIHRDMQGKDRMVSATTN